MRKFLLLVLCFVSLITFSACTKKEEVEVENAPFDFSTEKDVGVVIGTAHDKMIGEFAPNANIIYFNNLTDMYAAISLGKIYAGLTDESIAMLGIVEYDNLYLADKVHDQDYAFLLKKTGIANQIKPDLNKYINELIETGEMDELIDYWFGSIKSKKYDLDSLTGENGTIRIAVFQDALPFSYFDGKDIYGLEVDIMYGFAKEYGYKLEFTPMQVETILAYLSTDKADMAFGGFIITDERKEKYDFTDIFYTGGNSFIMANNSTSNTSLIEKLKKSFNSTFIVENRYLLFIDGIKSTIGITVLSVIVGTIIGIILFLLFSLKNSLINAILNSFSWIIRSTPIVVLLMIMYYIIFGKTDITGYLISIISFSLIFSITVLSIFKTCFMAIDSGQYEASYALGYNKTQTFFKIILPQMGPMFLPSYSAEIISLIKSTSIVGYIAVQDLTKVGDIIRGRTFDAFFPLISTTICYFAIMIFFTIVLDSISKKIDPKRRKISNIMKGVKTHD